MGKRTSCTVPQCDGREVASGLCNAHWKRLRDFGDVKANVPVRKILKGYTGPERLWLKSEPQGDCVVYTGTKDHAGYGKITWDGRQWSAHRMAWFIAFGPVPDETLDHLCSVRNCINVEHLEPVTQAENTRRAKGYLVAAEALKNVDVCRNGIHPWTPENIGITTNQRYCRPCKRATGRKTDAKRRRAAA